MKYLLLFLFSLFCTVNMYSNEKVGLTLIPPGKISNKINLDIRGGIVNRGNSGAPDKPCGVLCRC